jgi:hypothetical protein
MGCTKDYNSQYTATFVNSTSHTIKILFYKGGVVLTTDTIKLVQNQQFEFANGSRRGKLTKPGFSSNYFGNSNDSIVVIFDNMYKITHYGFTPLQLAPKHYLFENLRNIGNPNSYRFVSTPISSHGNKNDHYYDFKEQDYLDAK